MIKKIKCSRLGLSFIEVMVTVAVLSAGIVVIYKALITSMDYQNHYIIRLNAMHLMDKKIAEMEREYKEKGTLPIIFDGDIENVNIRNKSISFVADVEMENVERLDKLFLLNVRISWKERGKNFSIDRSTYISKI